MFIKRYITAVLVALIGLFSSVSYAATVQPQSGTFYFTTSASTATPAAGNYVYGTRVVGIKITPGTAASRYRLRVGTAVSGAILYETMSGATTAPLVLDCAQFRLPNTGIYFESSEAGADLKCFIYTDSQ